MDKVIVTKAVVRLGSGTLIGKLRDLHRRVCGIKQRAVLRMGALALVASFGALLPGQALAWEKISIAPVSFVQVSYNGSFGVQLVGVSNLCNPADTSFAWFDAVAFGPPNTIEGQKALLATLQAAKLAGTTVWVFAGIGSDGLCRLEVVNL